MLGLGRSREHGTPKGMPPLLADGAVVATPYASTGGRSSLTWSAMVLGRRFAAAAVV